MGFPRAVLKASLAKLTSCSAMEKVLITGFQKPHPVLWGFEFIFFHLFEVFFYLKNSSNICSNSPHVKPSLCRDRNIFMVVFSKKTQGKCCFYLFQ